MACSSLLLLLHSYIQLIILCISEKTAKRWLKKLGFVFSRFTKGIYFDGHERSDVVEFCKKFLEDMTELSIIILLHRNICSEINFLYFSRYQKMMPVFTGNQLEIRTDPELNEFEHLHILVTHDESTFDSNDGRREGWHPRNEQPLRKKSRGRSIHVSEFLTETIGRLKLSNEQIEAFGNSIPHEACVIMYPGKNQDGWWNLQQLIAQVRLQRMRFVIS